MSSMPIRRVTFIAVATLVLHAVPAAAAPLGTGITYQGLLRSSGAPVTGSYDFDFRLFTDSTGGTLVGTDQAALGVAVVNGLFTVSLDFGSAAFDGSARWLDIQVRAAGGPTYTALAPRQPVLAAPYALRAINGPSGASQWSNDANGIEYGSNVAIGSATHPDWRLYVETGTNNINPLVLKNNNASFATLFLENDATNGYGLYAPAPANHYIGGKLGLGATTPFGYCRLDVQNSGEGVRSTVTGTVANPQYNAAVVALGNTGTGVLGTTSMGVYAASVDDRGVWGLSANNLGVVGDNQAHGNSGWLGGLSEGVYGQATSTGSYGGRFTNTVSGGVALRVDGVGQVKTLQILGGADLAERFEVPSGIEPGTVMAIDADSPGRLQVARGAYCRTVAGVVSGAQGLAAGVELGRGEPGADTAPIALSGRVWVRCDARAGAIHPGDLLTTSERAGYAMRASDARRAPGAILGKAMSSLEAGTGSVLVLVSLQ
jgi:hypothetical protein